MLSNKHSRKPIFVDPPPREAGISYHRRRRLRTLPYNRLAHEGLWLRSRRSLRLPLMPHVEVSAWDIPTRRIRVGGPHVGTAAETKPAMMSSHALIYFLLGLPFQLLRQTTIAHSAIIPQSPGIAPTAVDNDMAHCVDNEGWVRNGIIKSDCAVAMSEFYRTNVLPRGGQEYEFYALGGPRTSRLPTILTPRKYDYGERQYPAPLFRLPCTTHHYRHVCYRHCNARYILARNPTRRHATSVSAS